MTREHLILTGFLILVVLVFILVAKRGIHTTQRLFFWIGVLILLSAFTIGLHRFLAGRTSLLPADSPVSLQGIGLGVLFLLLASLGCLCADHKKE